MKKIECLELENQVLRNVIACAMECIEIGKRTGEEYCITLGAVEGRLRYEEKIKYALELEKAIDYRKNAEMLQDCVYKFEHFDSCVILNDGNVIGFEY